MKIKNRPSDYVKRSDLPGRTVHVAKSHVQAAAPRTLHDFMNAEIDGSFYVSFKTVTVDPKETARRKS